MLFSEPKIPQSVGWNRCFNRHRVSVLFSEPKIPQSEGLAPLPLLTRDGFSALQRAENSSISIRCAAHALDRARFSALQRAENSSINSEIIVHLSVWCFSALQRAENSSMLSSGRSTTRTREFQCSSASRKFLNLRPIRKSHMSSSTRFSALQRAENSSI